MDCSAAQDLVLTKEIIYRTVGSTVELVCPIISARAISWLGPPSYQEYAVGTDIFPEVSNQVAVSETAADKKSILLIHRFRKDNSGDYKCTDGIDKKEFSLINKRNPSNLVISNKTDDKTTTVEGKEHNLECRVTSGQPGGNITWSTDGVVVARNEPSFVIHRLTPNRSDNGKIFECEAFNSDGEKILEASVRIEVFYIPKITFSPSQTITVKEGEDTQLICINDGNDPDTTTVWKIQRTETIISNNDTLKFKRVKRTDAGLYICMVQTKAGVYKENAKVVVQYAPTIDIQYVPTERKMKCIPSGVPDRYVYKDWEHTTEYNDHIRFLPITKEGNNAILTIPKHETGKDHQRDRGLYICRASNNISSSDGMFVVKKYNLNFKGKPYFASSTENIQFGAYLKTAMIKIHFVSVPEYNSYDVYKNESRFTGYNESLHRNMNLTDTVYGKNVSVKGNIISLQIQIDTLDDFNLYKVVVKNAEGSSHHTIQLVSASAPYMPIILQTSAKQTQIFVLWKPGFDGGYLQWFTVEYKEIGETYWNNQITNSSNVIVIGGLKPTTRYLIRVFATNIIADSNRTKEILIQTDEYAIAETFHSVHIVVILSLVIIIAVLLVAGMGLYVQNDDSILPMINRDVDVMSSEHTSTSSDNDIVSSEYLDDGYEQPHTTLVVTDQVKDEHVYLNTKKESNYENTIPFENIACGHACDYLDDSLSDKRNALDDHEYLNLNNDVNDFNVKNERVTQCFINPRMNEAEYINLSLNQ
ncbi:protein turtle homolog B-like [Mytilus trossulus]|uniref:protein turtle homolog B-like n=1 Tax=Mytilus trossulus TaxID=6551 RepID=UPI003005B9DA